MTDEPNNEYLLPISRVDKVTKEKEDTDKFGFSETLISIKFSKTYEVPVRWPIISPKYY